MKQTENRIKKLSKTMVVQDAVMLYFIFIEIQWSVVVLHTKGKVKG